MPNLTRPSFDRLIVIFCLIVIFVMFPGMMLFWHNHPRLTNKIAQAEQTASPIPAQPRLGLPENSGPPPIAAGTKATSFVSTTIDGKSYIFDSQAPHIKIVDFWATWCGPCHMAIPGLIDLNDSLKKSGVQVVGVSVDTDTASQVPSDAKSMGIDYTVLVDPQNNPLAASAYNASGLPSLYIIDGKGIVRWSFTGYWPDEEPYVRQVISEIQSGQPVQQS
jgi:thiol-disulfide isomerase/thioredoxin